MTEGRDYRVYKVNLPGDIHGAIRLDENGFASIYINDSLSPAASQRTLTHELRHLRRGDFTNELSIWECEAE